jgi:hypothetical protein
MCMKPKMPPPPVLPPERAAMRQPDGQAIQGAGRRTMDRMRSAADTILTSGRGVTSSGQTQGKTLLGQ